MCERYILEFDGKRLGGYTTVLEPGGTLPASPLAGFGRWVLDLKIQDGQKIGEYFVYDILHFCPGNEKPYTGERVDGFLETERVVTVWHDGSGVTYGGFDNDGAKKYHGFRVQRILNERRLKQNSKERKERKHKLWG